MRFGAQWVAETTLLFGLGTNFVSSPNMPGWSISLLKKSHPCCEQPRYDRLLAKSRRIYRIACDSAPRTDRLFRALAGKALFQQAASLERRVTLLSDYIEVSCCCGCIDYGEPETFSFPND